MGTSIRSSWATAKAHAKDKFCRGWYQWAISVGGQWHVIYNDSFGAQRGLLRYGKGPYLGDWWTLPACSAHQR